jgi:hypothetical protein
MFENFLKALVNMHDKLRLEVQNVYIIFKFILYNMKSWVADLIRIRLLKNKKKL